MADKKSDKKIDNLLNHNYDGIEEYDNDLPMWWIGLFVLTVVLGIGYAIWLHTGLNLPIVGKGQDQYANLEDDLAYAAAEKAANKPVVVELDEEGLLALAAKPDAVEAGKVIFQGKCAACHTLPGSSDGGGLVGPNLTDNYWIHGGKLTEIRTVIRTGVLDKGMLAWESQLKPDEIDHVVVYIRSLKGSNPAGAKEAQGLLVE